MNCEDKVWNLIEILVLEHIIITLPPLLNSPSPQATNHLAFPLRTKKNTSVPFFLSPLRNVPFSHRNQLCFPWETAMFCFRGDQTDAYLLKPWAKFLAHFEVNCVSTEASFCQLYQLFLPTAHVFKNKIKQIRISHDFLSCCPSPRTEQGLISLTRTWLFSRGPCFAHLKAATC